MKPQFWTLRQSADLPDTLELWVYSAVESNGYDWHTGEAIESETSAEHFRKELGEHPDAKEIIVYINSLGGSVMEGVAIYNQLKRHPAHKTVYVDGFACSIASVIAMAGDTIIMPRNTVMMIHNASTNIYGNAEELRKTADDLDTLNAAARQAYLLKAGEKLTEERLTEMLDSETYLTAEQCIEYGLADRFADDDADMEKAKAMLSAAKQQNMAAYAGMIEQICAAAAAEPESSAPPQKSAAETAAEIINKYFER